MGNVGCDIRSDIPWEVDWPKCFPLQSAVELVTQWGLDPSSIVTRLSNPLCGRLVHNVDSLRIIGANMWVQRTATCGYRPTFLRKPPVQRRAPAPPNVSEDAAPVLGQYVSSNFAVPKSKRTPDKWRPILNLKKYNEFIWHVEFQMEEIKWISDWLKLFSFCAGLDLKDAFLRPYKCNLCPFTSSHRASL